MENAEEILQCLDEFAKLRPKEIPPELEYYLSFVARTGDPVYQWPLIKCLFREKLLNVITEFYEACPSVEIPPCPNVEIFNYEAMKGFILEKLDTFAAAPFTVQRICELLTSPRKEYNRIDKYMRALEKNILVVSTREPGNRKSTENGESVVNGLESEHGSQEMVNSLNSDINVEVDMDEKTVWHKSYAVTESNIILDSHSTESIQIQESYVSESKTSAAAAAAAVAAAVAAAAPAPIPVAESVITTRQINYIGYTNEMLVEPSTTISGNETPDNNSDTDSGVPTGVFNLTRPAEKEDEQIYVTEESAFTKADCSEMETSQIISETETEPITPPEPEGSAEETPHVEKVQPESSEAIVESSSQAGTTSLLTSTSSSSSTTASATTSSTTTTTKEADLDPEKEISSNENETTISSSDESSTTHPLEVETNPNPEISASDQQEVTESNIVIGPEDMQVEDISPEPETQAEVEAEPEPEPETNADAEIETEAEAEAESSKPPTISDEIVAAPDTPAISGIPEAPETAQGAQPEVINVDNSTKAEENPRGSGGGEGSAGSGGDAPQVEEKTETPQEIVKVTESN